MIGQDELSKNLLTLANNLQRAIDLLNGKLTQGQQPKITVKGELLIQMSSLIQEEVRVLPENKMQPLQDAEFKQTQIEKIMAAALVTCQIFSIQGITKVTDDQAKSAFKIAIKQVNTIQPDNTIKIGTHRSNHAPHKPVKRVPINLADLIEAVPPKSEKSGKTDYLSKVVLAAMVAIGTASPAAGAGMIGAHLVNKHKEKIPKPLKEGKTRAAVKVAAVAGAVAVPAAAVGVVLESSRKGITKRLNKVANDLRDSSKTNAATKKSPTTFAKVKPKKQSEIKNNHKTTPKPPVKQKILSRFKKK